MNFCEHGIHRGAKPACPACDFGKVCSKCGDDLFKLGEATLHSTTNAMRCRSAFKYPLITHVFEDGPDGSHCRHCGWHKTIHEKFGTVATDSALTGTQEDSK